jgi:hypothetical protein
VEEEDVSGSVPQSWAKFSKNNVEESQGTLYINPIQLAQAITAIIYFLLFCFNQIL